MPILVDSSVPQYVILMTPVRAYDDLIRAARMQMERELQLRNALNQTYSLSTLSA